ncbi:hypothetical protein [Peptoanaerobacter stomatis]
MKQTPNYNLKKPDYTDVADIKELNNNMDILDKIIKSIADGQFTVEEAKRLFSLIGHNHDDSYLGKTSKASDSELLDGFDSTAFLRNYMGNGTLANDLGVAKELRWKHYGQNHVIFDASNSTTPSGRACDRSTPERGWHEANCPTLMGWNGHQTWGVKVSNCGWADGAGSIHGFQFRNNNGRLEVLINGVWLSVGGRQYTVVRSGTIGSNTPRFDYTNGSGVLRILDGDITSEDITLPKYNQTYGVVNVYIDGVKVEDMYRNFSYKAPLFLNLEFKHSISIVGKEKNGTRFIVQTEK